MNLKHYRNEALEAIARNVISQYDPCLLNNPAPIPVETIMEKVYGLTIEFQYIRNNGRILGETVFEDAAVPIYDCENNQGYKLIPVTAGTIIIDASLMDNRSKGRLRYTCAHELAHWVLHKTFFSKTGGIAAMTNKVRSSETGKIIERQADRLGSYLLMPKGTVKMAFYSNPNSTVESMAQIFGVSKKAMEIRLGEMRLLV